MYNWRRCLSCLVVVLAAGCMRTEAPSATVGPPPEKVTTEELRNYTVQSTDGETIGPVDGVVMDTETKTVQYVVVLLEDPFAIGKGSYLGPQNDYMLIPWSHLNLEYTEHLLTADVDARTINDAPVLDDLPDTSAPDWDTAIRRYWAGQ